MVVVVVGVVVTLFEKMPKAFLVRNGLRKLRMHIRDHIPDRSAVSDF